MYEGNDYVEVNQTRKWNCYLRPKGDYEYDFFVIIKVMESTCKIRYLHDGKIKREHTDSILCSSEHV